MRYQHSIATVSNGTIIPIYSGFSPQQTSAVVGITAYEGPPYPQGSCAWYGYHLHQEQISGGPWTKLSYPDEDTCNAPNMTVDCTPGVPYDINTYAMLRINWTY